MAKKHEPEATTTKRIRKIPVAVQNLQADLEEMAQKAEITDTLAEANTTLSLDKARVEQENRKLKESLNKARTLEQGLTEDDIQFLKIRKAIIQFDRNHKTGLYFVDVRGTAPDQPRTRTRAPTIQAAIKALRPQIPVPKAPA